MENNLNVWEFVNQKWKEQRKKVTLLGVCRIKIYNFAHSLKLKKIKRTCMGRTC